MARIKALFDKSGDSFKVANACTPDNPTGCVGSFKNLLGNMAQFNDGDVQYTEEYFRHNELPPQLETVSEDED